ncbi:VanZ family protein [Thalassotalea euphylliae]|uniref:VanZ family protein n=1 Tax=Thalassotalea euphylliae TaxID=1655234 RepID=UPI003625160A
MNKLIAALYIIIAYGSLYPLSFSIQEFSESASTWLRADMPSIGDVLGNILLFMPLGFVFRLNALKQGLPLTQVRTSIKPMASALLFAFILQVLQVGIAERDQNIVDVVFNGVGLLLGYIAISMFDRVKFTLSNPLAALPVAIVIGFLLAQLVPFVPSIDFQAFKNSIKPLLILPELNEMAFIAIDIVTWLVMFRLLGFWRQLPIGLFVVGYVSLLVAKVVVYQNTLSWAIIIAPIVGYVAYRIRDWHHEGNLKRLYMMFLIAILCSGFISTGEAVNSAFSLLPFHSYLSGQIYAGVSTVLLKLSLFSGVLWLSLELGYRLKYQALMLAGLVMLSELSQLLNPSRTFDVGDVVLVGLAFLLVRHVGDLLADIIGNPSEDKAVKQPVTAAKLTDPAVRENRNVKPVISILSSGFILLYVVISIVLSLPGIPYNVRELFENNGSLLDVLFFYLFLLLLFGGAYWAAYRSSVNRESTLPELLKTQGTLLVLAFMALALSVSDESLQDILGASVYAREIMAMRGESNWVASIFKILSLSTMATIARYIEYFIRFAALVGFAYFSLLLVFTWNSQQSLAHKLKVTAITIFAMVFSYVTVFINASTDNLTELIASPLAIATLFVFLSVFASLIYMISSSSKRIHLAWIPLILIIAVAGSWYILGYGLEPVIVKYGQTFSALDFLLGPDREHQLTQSALLMRWAGLVLGFVAVTCFSCAAGRALLSAKWQFNLVVLPKKSLVYGGAASGVCVYLLYRLFGEPFHIQTINTMFSPPQVATTVAKSVDLSRLTHDPGVITVDGKVVKNFQTALRVAKHFSEIKMTKGLYRASGVITANNVKIIAEPGAVIFGSAAQGKGAIVAKGNNLIIDGLECHSISVPSNNGVCVRLEGSGVTLNNVYFHHAQGGLLGSPKGGDIVIQNSRFEFMGQGSFFHGIYTMQPTRLIVRNSTFLNTQNGGHEIKSRSYYTEITQSIVGSNATRDSRLIDIPNGGDVLIEQNMLIEGAYSENHDLFSWGVEGVAHESGHVAIKNNVLIVDKPYARLMAVKGNPDSIDVTDNLVVGDLKGVPEEFNTFFKSREELGIKPAPHIPEMPR